MIWMTRGDCGPAEEAHVVAAAQSLEAIAAGHPSARIDELMPWNFDKQA